MPNEDVDILRSMCEGFGRGDWEVSAVVRFRAYADRESALQALAA